MARRLRPPSPQSWGNQTQGGRRFSSTRVDENRRPVRRCPARTHPGSFLATPPETGRERVEQARTPHLPVSGGSPPCGGGGSYRLFAPFTQHHYHPPPPLA